MMVMPNTIISARNGVGGMTFGVEVSKEGTGYTMPGLAVRIIARWPRLALKCLQRRHHSQAALA
jgi:hypothetical protein